LRAWTTIVLHWLLSRRRRRPDAALRICWLCRGDYVVPIDSRITDEEHWWLRLRCGQCGSGREVTITNDEAQRYDRELGVGMAVIERVVRDIDRESMEREVETLIAALRHDLVDASDFAE
jgi:hypothetical protein